MPVPMLAHPMTPYVAWFGFEYAMTDPAIRWLILDNHHNVFVTVGDLPVT